MNVILVILISMFSNAKDAKNESLRPGVTVPQQPVPSGSVDLNQYKDVHLKKKNEYKSKLSCTTPTGMVLEEGSAGYESCLGEAERSNAVHDKRGQPGASGPSTSVGGSVDL